MFAGKLGSQLTGVDSCPVPCCPAATARFEPSLPAAVVTEQKKLGPQSLRKQKKAGGRSAPSPSLYNEASSSCKTWRSTSFGCELSMLPHRAARIMGPLSPKMSMGSGMPSRHF